MKQVFLLGAGFTKAVMGERALLTDEIMPKLDISTFPEVYTDYTEAYPDIEQFITRIDLKYFQFKKTNVSLAKRFKEIREKLEYQIVEFFNVEKLGVDNLRNFFCLKAFISKIPKESTIITLNYDCVLDQGLYLSRRWSPDGGYLLSSFPFEEKQKNHDIENILLLKPHGSINFRVPSEKLAKEIKLIDIQKIFIETTCKIFPKIHADFNSPKYCDFYSNQPYVLAMTYLKVYANGILRIGSKAIEELKIADKLTIIGCSLREEDTFLRFVLRHFGEKEKAVEKKFLIEIIDPNEIIWRKIENELIDKSLVGNPGNHEIKCFKSLSDYPKP
jgi:hypothetical protein